MKQLFKSFLYAALLLATSASILADCGNDCGSSCGDCTNTSSSTSTSCRCNCVSVYEPRPAIDNLAFLMAGQPPYEADKECFGGYFYLGYHYDRSMTGCRNHIAECLFGNSSVQFIGSVAADTVGTSSSSTVVIADYLGMGVETNATWAPCPRIQSHNVDFAFRFQFDEWVQGLWLDVRLPVQIAKWQLDLNSSATTSSSCNSCDSCNNCGGSGCSSCTNSCNDCCGTGLTGTVDTTAFHAGYMNKANTSQDTTSWATITTSTAVETATSVCEALSGTFAFGDMPGFTYGQINCNNCCNVSKLADVSFDLGYDFISCDDYHLALYLRVVAPTGTKLDTCYAQSFFKPIIGNGHHTELGGGIRAHAVLWDCNDHSKLTMKFEGYATHLFSNCQTRTFDFANKGCLSRYMLLKRFTNSGDLWVYDGALMGGTDYTTRGVNVAIKVKGEAALKFEWSWCNWVFGLGTEIWGRTCEEFCNVGAPIPGLYDAQKRYGFKGGTGVSSTGYRVNGSNVIQNAILPLALAETGAVVSGGLSATASNATASSIGTVDYANTTHASNILASSNYPAATSTAYVDYRVFNGATVTAGTTTLTESQVAKDSSSTQASVSNTSAVVSDLSPAPVTLATEGDGELDLGSGASPSQLTGKVFGDISYCWNNSDWKPTLSLYGMGEFAPSSYACALSQWSVGARIGISF